MPAMSYYYFLITQKCPSVQKAWLIRSELFSIRSNGEVSPVRKARVIHLELLVPVRTALHHEPNIMECSEILRPSQFDLTYPIRQ